MNDSTLIGLGNSEPVDYLEDGWRMREANEFRAARDRMMEGAGGGDGPRLGINTREDT